MYHGAEPACFYNKSFQIAVGKESLCSKSWHNLHSPALCVLKQLAPETVMKVKVLLSDMSNTFYNSWTSVINPDVNHTICIWHIERSWKAKIKNEDLLSDIQSLRYICNKEKFMAQVDHLQQY